MEFASAHCSSEETAGGNSGSSGSGASDASGGESSAGSGGAGATGGGGGGGAGGTGAPGGAGGTVDCGDPGPTWHAAWVAIEEQVIDLVNTHRQAGATCGSDAIAPVSTVLPDDALTLNSRTHSAYMSSAGIGTTGPDGSPLDVSALRCFDGDTVNVTVAMGQPDATALVDALLADSSTCDNIFAAATHIGVGYYSTSAPDAGSDAGPSGSVFWTILLAR